MLYRYVTLTLFVFTITPSFPYVPYKAGAVLPPLVQGGGDRVQQLGIARHSRCDWARIIVAAVEIQASVEGRKQNSLVVRRKPTFLLRPVNRLSPGL